MNENSSLCDGCPWWKANVLLEEFDGAMSKLPYPVVKEAWELLEATLTRLNVGIAKKDWTLLSIAIERLEEYQRVLRSFLISLELSS